MSLIWVVVGRTNPTKSWLHIYDNTESENIWDIYMQSFYFIMTTITTVGFGDYTGSTTEEYIFTMLVEVNHINLTFLSLIIVCGSKLLLLPYGIHKFNAPRKTEVLGFNKYKTRGVRCVDEEARVV